MCHHNCCLVLPFCCETFVVLSSALACEFHKSTPKYLFRQFKEYEKMMMRAGGEERKNGTAAGTESLYTIDRDRQCNPLAKNMVL